MNFGWDPAHEKTRKGLRQLITDRLMMMPPAELKVMLPDLPEGLKDQLLLTMARKLEIKPVLGEPQKYQSSREDTPIMLD